MSEQEAQNNGEIGEGVVDKEQAPPLPTTAPPSTAPPTTAPAVPDTPPPVSTSVGEGEGKEEPKDELAADLPTDFANYGVEAAKIEEEETGLQTETACVGGILVASCVELAQAAQNCTDKFNKCEDENGFAVAVGTISLFLCLLYVIFLKFRPQVIRNFTQYLSLFLLIWWGVGVIVLTFKSPFNTTGNGYFACWGAALLSIYYCQVAVEKLKVFGERMSNAISGSLQRKLIVLLMFLSYVEAFASLVLWDERNTAGSIAKKSNQEVWIFACGIIAGGLSTIYLLLEIFRPGMIKAEFLKFFSWFMVIWWMFGAGVATFDDPFPTTGNGYFCAWGAFVSSFYLAYVTTVTTVAM